MSEKHVADMAAQANRAAPQAIVAADRNGQWSPDPGPGSNGSWDSRSSGGFSHYSQTPGSNGVTPLRAAEPRVAAAAAVDATILIVDDCALYREALAANLRMKGIVDVLMAWDLPSLISVLEDAEPRVILLNIATYGLPLILRAATSLNPDAAVIVVAASEDDEDGVIACAEAGVAGYHMRTESFADLLVLIGDVTAGKVSCPPQVSAMLLRRLSVLATHRQPAPKDPVLTTRETQILGMLELGRSNQDIAAQLSIAVHTVKNHVHSLLTKLGVATRAEAAALSHSLRVDRDAHGRARSRSSQNWL